MQADFPLWNDGSDRALDPAVEAFLERSGEPPIAFTPGSANVHGRKFFEAAVDACRRLGRRGILLTQYAEQISASLPDGVVHCKYVPLDLLLPRCAAFVHHGGIGSTSQGLAAGVPQLITPLAHDQFDNGERVKGLGVGEWIAETKLTGAKAAAALTRLLDPRTAASCRAAAERLGRRDGLDRAAALIEGRLRHADRSV